MQSPGEHRRAPGAPPRPSGGGLGRRLGPLLGASLAAAASTGLVFWISTADESAVPSAPVGAPAPATRAYAPRKADADQVIRAYEQMQEIYADRGLSGVLAFNRACADSVGTDPTVLDFCLAFDIYAAALGRDEGPASLQDEAQARELALAQGATAPGTDAAVRVAAVQALARQASLLASADSSEPAPSAAAPASSAPPPPVRRAAAEGGKPAAKAPARARPARPAKAKTAAATSCRSRATAAQRAVCASAALRKAEARVRTAYRRALAAGADERRLAREQARWRRSLNAAAPNRTAMARLYQKRTRELDATTRRLRASRG